MFFDMVRNILILDKKIYVRYQNNKFYGKKLLYDLKEGIITISKMDSRVTILL